MITYDGAESHAGRYTESEPETELILRERTSDIDPTAYELREGDVV